ncbi:beta-1,6-N-acetylglucosaminyltransferase [Streptococcus suis]
MTNKHAYLLMVHKYDVTLKYLLSQLDCEEVDIFIHVDNKCKDFPFETALKSIRKGNIYFTTERISVFWGGDSQILTELLLLKEATSKGTYAYYHLLSGNDLLLKSISEVNNFFQENRGKEFVDFFNPEFIDGKRVYYRHFFRNRYARSSTISQKLIKVVSKLLLYIQIFCGITRNTEVKFQKGANWFSITDGLARHVLSKENWIKKIFRNTDCADEIFLQTIVINSKFKDNIFNKQLNNTIYGNMRLTLWDGKDCHVFNVNDISLLEKTDALIARKFDLSKDIELLKWFDKS